VQRKVREIQPFVILNLPWQVKNPPAASRSGGVWGFFNRFAEGEGSYGTGPMI
jgi:hypothetical protein